MFLIHALLWTVTVFIGLMTFLPLTRIPHGFIRGGDFPRQQMLLTALAMLPVIWWTDLPGATGADLLLLATIVGQLLYIGRYLPGWQKQSLRPLRHEVVSPERTISILAANVKKSNRDFARLEALARRVQPDLLIALEVDAEWIAALDRLRDIYDHGHACPLDNGYGMMVLSRFPMPDGAFREKVVAEVPSLRTSVVLPSGDQFRLYVVHPEPPVPQHDTEGRDAELAQIAFEAAEDDLPVIVSGDLNDVAWSHATRQFQRISRLLDPRVGRGFYNTFSATNPLMRWPLDQLFHDPRFRFLGMQRLAHIGSDHFPMLFQLLLTPQARAAETPDPISTEEAVAARDMIAREKASDREAIGRDWEDNT